ncbi:MULTISPECIES: winged helix DNA-binding domain-containing protein [unclassified Kribbella]|uniref:winged helix DNA-binding domain-containing protein n=1 Tax=unclassified Kribbella TaxID=2644121 RepID=UPI003015D4B7
MAAVLRPRVLGRALLERQLLLRRTDLDVVPAVEQVFGLNAQNPNDPYLALWSRLESFTLPSLTAAIEDGSLVRSTMMRATQHLMSVPDFQFVRPVLAPLLRRVQRNAFGRRTAGVDLDALVIMARELLADGRTLTRPELGRLLAERWPVDDPTALGWTAQYLEPLIHPAPSGTWNVYGATPFALPEVSLSVGDVRQMILRYLAAFGPATVADARTWSGVSGLREVFAELRPSLQVYVDESGRELFDLPDQPLPSEDVPAPVRFLPPFDATLLGHADRTRIMTDEIRRQVCIGAGVAATVLVDGTVAATWTVDYADDAAVLTVQPLRLLTDPAAVEAEAARLLTFISPTNSNRIELLPLENPPPN